MRSSRRPLCEPLPESRGAAADDMAASLGRWAVLANLYAAL
jgi:hypothetical protein